jgi:hypothetical protein
VGREADEISLAQAQENKPAPQDGAQPQFVLTDCVSFKEHQLTVKFRLDESFSSYVSAKFAYPKQGSLKNAKVGETYLMTFAEAEAAHNVKSARLIEENDLPASIPDRSLVGKVVEVNEKSAVLEWKKDDNTRAFFSQPQVFPIRSERQFSEGQTIKIVFGKDNRHCMSYGVVDDKPKNKSGP